MIYSEIKSLKTRNVLLPIVGYITLVSMSIVSLIPFVWMVSTSLKSQKDVFVFPPKWLPEVLKWDNYSHAWHAGGLDFSLMFYNTFLIAFPVVTFTVLASSLAAYAFARINFIGKSMIFMVLLASIMLPGMVSIIPAFIVFSKLNWIDTFKPLIIPGLFGNAFAIFLIRQFFLTLPKELEDAAMIDGCSRFRIWWKMFLPLSKPALATIVIFTFQGVYNDFMGPLIFLNSQSHFTVQMGLASFQSTSNGSYSTRYELLMAASTITILPMVLLFLLAQRYFIEGIALSGVKG